MRIRKQRGEKKRKRRGKKKSRLDNNMKKQISVASAKRVGQKIGVDFSKVPLAQFHRGMRLEYKEHSKALGGSITRAGMIAHDHIKEHPNSYKKK